MTEGQAKEIVAFFQDQLNENGFSEIDQEILLRWYESNEELEKFSQHNFLRFYIIQAINVFESYSNTKVIESSISRINKVLENGELEDISLEYFEGTERREFDLKKLSNYEEQIANFQSIANQLFPQ